VLLTRDAEARNIVKPPGDIYCSPQCLPPHVWVYLGAVGMGRASRSNEASGSGVNYNDLA
jgi:hypothetical protein